MRIIKLLACSAAFLFVTFIAAFSQTAPATQTPAKPKSATPKPATSPYDRALLKPALLKDKAPDTFQIKFETTRGEFTVSVFRAWAPLGVDRFYNLVKHHYYNGARVFRVLPNFVAQFGISAHPPVNAAWEKATIKDDPVIQKNMRGTLTFAKTAAPNSRTVEIFINLKDNPSLDAQGFAPFGVIEDKGINIVEMFYDQYGDAAGMDQEAMSRGGEQYIATKWPKLDTLKSVSLIAPAATTPAKPAAPKPAASTAAKPSGSL
jgi:peptidyl-prolyl cis-trans isomerase A (cyclophilin A)